MFENLGGRLNRSFKLLKGEGKITEVSVAETLRDVRKTLLNVDVNYEVAKSFTDMVKKKALGQNVLTSAKFSQLIVKIVHDESASLMEGTAVDVNLRGNPAIILMSGLQGSGKITFTGKLVSLLKTKKNKRPLLVAYDTYRPTAIERLHIVGEQVGIPVYMGLENKNPVEIAMNAIRGAQAKDDDAMIMDIAGRLAIDEQTMNEIAAVESAIQPGEILFVIDAMTGQDAVNTARELNERLNLGGVVLTELDGDTCGGTTLSIRTAVDKPIRFVSTGEKMDALDIFHPEHTANRILGMGDIVSLVECVQEQCDEEEVKRLWKKIARNQLDFNDLIFQIQQIKKTDSLKGLVPMIPGIGKTLKDVDIDDNALKSIEAIIYSMTPDEHSDPAILNGSRRQRIAKGSGTSIQEVSKLIKQFDETRKMMRMPTSAKSRRVKLPSVKPSFRCQLIRNNQ